MRFLCGINTGKTVRQRVQKLEVYHSLPGINALAQYENSQITAEKSFITLAPGNFSKPLFIETVTFFLDNRHEYCPKRGSLTEGEGSIRFTSLY
jgi:hypothetical protein